MPERRRPHGEDTEPIFPPVEESKVKDTYVIENTALSFDSEKNLISCIGYGRQDSSKKQRSFDVPLSQAKLFPHESQNLLLIVSSGRYILFIYKDHPMWNHEKIRSRLK